MPQVQSQLRLEGGTKRVIPQQTKTCSDVMPGIRCRELGDYLSKFVRRGDLACRYGGDEFTLILPECSLEDTRRRAEELRTSFQQLSIKHRDIFNRTGSQPLGNAFRATRATCRSVWRSDFTLAMARMP